jgi:hypothetical protein
MILILNNKTLTYKGAIKTIGEKFYRKQNAYYQNSWKRNS